MASLEYRTIKNTSIAVFILWAIVGLVTIPVFKTHGISEESNDTNQTVWCNFDDEEYSESGFFVAFFVSSYAIPLLLIIFLYIGMLHRLWNPGSLGNKISKESLRNKRRVTK